MSLRLVKKTPLADGVLSGICGILPRLLQRSKKCRGHYSTIYHAMSQLIHISPLTQSEEIRAFEVPSHVNYM